MRTLILYRRLFAHGTFGVLCDEFGNELCKTVERPWLDNRKGESCVPNGTYDLLPHQSPKFGKCYALSSPELGVTVYGPSLRTHILIHPANRVDQLQGCIAPGLEFGVLKNDEGKNVWAVLNSKTAFNQLLNWLNNEPARLIIKAA